MNQDEREIYDRLRRIAEFDSAVAVTVRTEDLKVMLNAFNFADSEAKTLALKLQEAEARVAALKSSLASELRRYNQASDTINQQAAQIEKLEDRLDKASQTRSTLDREVEKACQMLNQLEQELAEIRLQAGGMQMEIDELQADAHRYRFLKTRVGERDLDGGYTQMYVFPVLDRDNGNKKLPIGRQYFTDIDACVDYHRSKA